MTRRTLALLLALAAFALGAAACGGDDGEETDEPAAANEGGGGGGGGGGTIQLAADPDGAPAFDQTELTASAGEIVIEFTNESSVPHNVTLENVEGGATETITGDTASVTVNLEPGTYTYFCSVGGHRSAGMEGTLTVE